MKEDLKKIFRGHGLETQVRKFNEESDELREAIIRADEHHKLQEWTNREYAEYHDHIAEEIADNFVLLKQFQYYYGFSDEKIEEIMKFKIQRTIEELENER